MNRILLWISLLSLLPATGWTGSQSLLEVFEQAKLHDPVLASASHASKASQTLIEQAKATYRPAINFTATANAAQTDVKLIGGNNPFREGRNNFEGYTARVEARQPIYRRENLQRLDQSYDRVSIADKQYLLAEQTLILRTTQAYFDVLQAQDRIALLEAQKLAIQSQLKQAQATFDVGTATITDVNEAQARYDLVVAQELAARNDLAVAQYSLQAITGQTAPALSTVKPTLQINTELKPLTEWQTVTNDSNLAIQIQQDTLKLNEKEIEIARSGHYPTVDAVATYLHAYSNGGQNGFGSDLKSAVVGVELSVPLYLGGGVNARVEQAAFNQQKALDDLENARRQATLDTQRAYLNLSTSIATVKALEQALVSSQSQLDSTKLGYEVGVRTSVDVLNAQQQLYSAKRDLLQARYQYLVNIIRLKVASGIVTEADLQDINQQLVKQ